MSNSLFEAFQALETLNEEVFDVSGDGIAKLKEFEDGDTVEEMETIIDPLAETDEDLQASYLGKAILNCIICQSKIYKDPSEVVLSEDDSLVNVGEECPYCQSPDGFKVIGQVAEYNPAESEETTDEITDVKIGDEEDSISIETTGKKGFEAAGAAMDKFNEDNDLLDESVKTREEIVEEEGSYDAMDESIITRKGIQKQSSMKEDFNKVDIETDTSKMTMTSDDNGKVTVTTEPIETASEIETIAPVSTEVEAEIMDTPAEEPEYQDFEIDEFDETEFDALGESYLKRVYENVNSYKTTKGSIKGNQLKLEGIINFKSGKQAKTNFVFESKTVTKTGKLKLIGENQQFAKGKKSFTLTGRADGKKLIAEGLTYNYRAKDAKTGASKRLYGTVSR